MNKLVKILVIAAIALLSVPASATPELTPHRAEYKVRISVVSGNLSTELRRTKNGYVANHVIIPTGMSRMLTRGAMDVTSAFDSDADGVKPISYRAIDTIRDEPEVDLHFDWSTNTVSGTVGDEEFAMLLEGIAHDSVSIQYQLMHDLLTGSANTHYTLFDIDELKIANISNAGERQVETKAGRFTAVGIRHQKESSSRITTLWCVAELGYLPVIIEQHSKGKLKFRASLLSYTPAEVPNLLPGVDQRTADE